MERWKAVVKKLLRPGGGWAALAVFLGGISLALTFLVFGDDSPFAYASYVLSAYGLTVFIAAILPMFSAAQRLLHRIPLTHRYLTDHYFKVRSSLRLSFLINVCYAGFKLICSIRYTSFWDGALAVYNILLCAVRIYLIWRMPAEQQELDMSQELRYYRTTGFFLIALDIALSGIATQIVRNGQGSDYPGMLIYVAALYAFYSLTLAIVNAVKFRKFNRPVLSAAKVVNLTAALVSIFNLETAMIAQFGAEQVYFRLVMTACTAFAVCVMVLDTAIFMVISANKKLGRLTG